MILVHGEISQSLEYQGREAKEYEEYNRRTSEDGTCESVKMSTLIAENLYKVAQAKDAKLASTKDTYMAQKVALRACAKMTLTSEQTIPSKVMDIKITTGTVTIVIVVEHRNIGTRLNSIQKDLPNAVIIMVNLPSNRSDALSSLTDIIYEGSVAII